MQFNSEANNQDLISQINFYCATSNTDYSVNDKTRNINNAYHEAAQIIQGADGTWEWDDTNNTTLPFGTTNLVSGQRDYGIDDAMLEIERVECKDANGNWKVLTPISEQEIKEPYNTFESTSGTPLYYDKVGSSLFLFPGTNYNSTDGLRVQFKRGANVFAVTDTTKSPGFNIRFHDFLCLSAAIAYCMLYKQERVQVLLGMKDRMADEMRMFYGRRQKDERKGMRPFITNTK